MLNNQSFGFKLFHYTYIQVAIQHIDIWITYIYSKTWHISSPNFIHIWVNFLSNTQIFNLFVDIIDLGDTWPVKFTVDCICANFNHLSPVIYGQLSIDKVFAGAQF